MTRSEIRHTRILAAALAVVILLVSACSGPGTAAQQEDVNFVSLDDVTPLADPKTWEGPSTASLPVLGIDPVATDPTPQLPVTVTDSQGTEVTIDDVSRILALDLYGTTSRTIFELGLGDNIVGRDTSSAYPEVLDRPLVTPSGHDLNAEAILALAPTLIITDSSLGPWDVILQMRDAGVSVVVVDSHRSMETIADLTRQVATAVGLPEEGDLLAERTQRAVDATVAQIAGIAPAEPDRKLRVVFLYMRGQSGVYYLFGKGSGTDSLITALGAVDVASEVGIDGMVPMTDEGLVAAAPDVVLVMSKGLESVGGVDGITEHVPAFANTPAGQNRRVIDMADTEVLSFGPNTPAVLESLAVALYAPQEQGDTGPEAPATDAVDAGEAAEGAADADAGTPEVAQVPDQPATVGLSQQAVQAGRVLGFTGQGFTPGEQVVVTLGAGEAGAGPLTAGRFGEVAGAVTLSVGMRAGTHVIRLLGAGSGQSAEADVSVMADPATLNEATPQEVSPGWEWAWIAVFATGGVLLLLLVVSLVSALLRRRSNKKAGPSRIRVRKGAPPGSQPAAADEGPDVTAADANPTELIGAIR